MIVGEYDINVVYTHRYAQQHKNNDWYHSFQTFHTKM